MKYDVAIIGGGLAGLSLSIQLAKSGYAVVLFEKEHYPFHRVCGEYISMESWDFLTRLGLDLSSMNLPLIRKLTVTAPNGNRINTDLPLGGFGISRFLIDHLLYKIAIGFGVEIREGSKVEDVAFHNHCFHVSVSGNITSAGIVCGSFGKRSNLDVKWSRPFIQKKPGKLNNWIGIKYHVKTNHPADTIALHNFSNGYCGISKIEDDRYCLCYLTTASNLKKSNNSIATMEKEILFKNPYLNRLFTTSTFLFDKPEIISQISFDKKKPVEDHMLMLGDAAGMITPLCGNGMSMAMHSSLLAFTAIDEFLKGKISRGILERQYVNNWNIKFVSRLKTGRLIQSFFGKEATTNAFIFALKPFPFVIRRIIRSTHGKPF